jgi:hypothetical protein
MTSAQDSLIARDAKPLSPDPALDRRSGEVTAANGVTRSKPSRTRAPTCAGARCCPAHPRRNIAEACSGAER